MQLATEDCQRDNRRLSCAMSVRFSINGGPEQTSTTINLTERSLAIKAAADVQKGDLVIVRIDLLPVIEGEVIRVWDEGFAITLAGGSCALVALAHSSNARQGRQTPQNLGPAPKRRRVAGALVSLIGEENLFCRLVSSTGGDDGLWSHAITIIKPGMTELEAIRSIWLSIGDARWIARIQRTRSRRGAVFIHTTISGWQLQMAANHGLAVSVVLNDLTEWRATAPADYLCDHLDQVSASGLFKDYVSRTGQRQRQAS